MLSGKKSSCENEIAPQEMFQARARAHISWQKSAKFLAALFGITS